MMYFATSKFFNKDGKPTAQWKYGENHYKAAALLGLVTSETPFETTYLGKKYMDLSDEMIEKVRPRLCLRVPIIEVYLIEGRKGYFDGMKKLRDLLTEATAVRRRSSIKQMLNQVLSTMPLTSRDQIIENISWK